MFCLDVVGVDPSFVIWRRPLAIASNETMSAMLHFLFRIPFDQTTQFIDKNYLPSPSKLLGF